MSDGLVMVVGWLDSLPNAVRAMLSAAVLAGALCWVEARLPRDFSGLAIAFRKAALLALVAIPLTVLIALDLRFVVAVEELPTIDPAPPVITWTLLSAWLAGALVRAALDARRIEHRAAGGAAPPELAERLEFWRERVGVRRSVALRMATTERPATRGLVHPVISVPRSAPRWPAAVQDAVLAHELDHVRHHHFAWLMFGRLVAYLYWPIPWVRGITEQLGQAFQRAADARAIEFFGDRLGYTRALAHIAQRIDPLPHEAPTTRLPLLAWDDSTSLEQRAAEVVSSVSRDPCYDRVFWGLAQATLAVFVLTGTTLKQVYELEEEIIILPEDYWYAVIGRSSRYEDIKDWASMPPAERSPKSVDPGASP